MSADFNEVRAEVEQRESAVTLVFRGNTYRAMPDGTPLTEDSSIFNAIDAISQANMCDIFDVVINGVVVQDIAGTLLLSNGEHLTFGANIVECRTQAKAGI